jgi:hypothetical protein
MRVDFKYRTLTVVWFKNIFLGGKPGVKFKIGGRFKVGKYEWDRRIELSLFFGYYILRIDLYKRFEFRSKKRVK